MKKKDKQRMSKALELLDEASKVIEDLDYGIDFEENELKQLRSSFYLLRKKREEFEEWSALYSMDKYLKDVPEVESVSFYAEFSSDDQGGGDYYLYCKVGLSKLLSEEEKESFDSSTIEENVTDIMSTFDTLQMDGLTWERKAPQSFKIALLGEERLAAYQKKMLESTIKEKPALPAVKRI